MAIAGSNLTVHPHCLMFFVDESGHEEFADPKHPVYVLGGCGLLAAAIDPVLRTPWREMKDRHFGGADKPLHASQLPNPTPAQAAALGAFFRNQAFGRFAVAMTKATSLPADTKPIEIMPGVLRKRWEELTPRFNPQPVEVAFIHEASERGDPLLERYFGKSVVVIDGQRVPTRHALMPKGDEALEVADFVVHAAAGQARRGMVGDARPRRDFDAVFRTNPLWTSFIAIDAATQR